MPCDTVTVSAVGGLEKAIPELVKAALAVVADSEPYGSDVLSVYAPRYSVGLSWVKGQGLTVKARTEQAAQAARAAVVQAYSRAALAWAATRSGWRVGAVAGSVNKLVLQR